MKMKAKKIRLFLIFAAISLVTLAAGALPAAATTMPLFWQSSFGTMAVNCDNCTSSLRLPFDVNYFGTTYNTASLSSNGFVVLGHDGSYSYDGNSYPGAPEFFSHPGIVAAMSTDLVGPAYYNFSPTAATFTWGPSLERFGLSGSNAQLTFLPDGEIILGYSDVNLSYHYALAGVSNGAVSPNPGWIYFTSGLPGHTINGMSYYYWYGSDGSALEGHNVYFTADADGYLVTSAPVTAPEPATLTLVLAGTGIAGLASRLRRSK